MGAPRSPAMLATLGGALALLLGLAVLLLPLLAPELSRARDAVWGAVVLLLGLVLVTSADRLTGAPMLGVLCGGLLIGRLAVEVGQGRWFRLTPEEQQKLWSAERWQTVLAQLRESVAKLLAIAGGAGGVVGDVVGGWIAARNAPKSTGKRWVRPEAAPAPAAESTPERAATPEIDPAATAPTAPQIEPQAATVISSLDEVDALLDAASDEPSGEAG
jgi:hypothetical protein